MLSKSQKTFCAGMVAGQSAAEAYRTAYPKRAAAAAERAAAELLTRPEIAAEIARLRGEAQRTETTETTDSTQPNARGGRAAGAAGTAPTAETAETATTSEAAEISEFAAADGAAESLVEKVAASAVLTRAEKREFLARVVRANLQDGSVDGDLLQSVDITRRGEDKVLEKQRLADKLKAIQLDNDLAGEGAEAEAQDALSALLERIRR